MVFEVEMRVDQIMKTHQDYKRLWISFQLFQLAVAKVISHHRMVWCGFMKTKQYKNHQW